MASELAAPGFAGENLPLLRLRVASVLGTVVFSALMTLLVITAIPYGTAEAWWKAFFVCAVLSMTIVWLVEGWLNDSWISDGLGVLLPIAALAGFSFLQTVSFGGPQTTSAGISVARWSTISLDPYQTRFFGLQLVGLLLAGAMLFRYASTERRLRILINVVIGVAVASALFGILRQTMQHGLGFGLPLLGSGSGYAQFINKNHFAFLMEMAFGLILGLIIGRGARREHLLFYVALLMPIWAALALCGSRGGLIAMMMEVVAAVLVFQFTGGYSTRSDAEGKWLRVLRSLPIRIAMTLILFAGAVVGTLWLGGDPLATKIEDTGAELAAAPSEARTGATRNEIWKTTWKMFLDNPVLGVGMGAYWVAVPAYHDAAGTMTPKEAHNDYLELLASGGVIGFLILIWFTVVVARRAKVNLQSRHRFHRAACLGALIGITGVAVHSLLDFGLHMIVNALVFTTLVVIATSKPRWAGQSADQS